MKSRLLLLSAIAAATFAAPAVASADDYCVGSPPGCSGTPESDLQTALDAAKGHSGPDRVLIGPGTYTRPDGFDYQDIAPTNTVEIFGVGSPQPVVTLTVVGGSYQFALDVNQNGSTVHDLTFDVPSQNGIPAGIGVGSGVTAHGITVNSSGPLTVQPTGVYVSGGTLADSSINMQGPVGIGVDVNTSSPTTVRDCVIVASRGIDSAVGGGATATLHRNRIAALQAGLFNYYGDVDVDNTLIDLRGGSGNAIYMDTVDATLDTNTVDATELTIRNGDASSAGVRQTNFDPNSVQTINLRDSIIWDVGHPIVQMTPAMSSTYTVNSFNMDYDQADNLPLAGSLVAGQVRTETTINTVDPGFLNPVSGANGLSGDYRLAFDSLMIDKDNLPINPGETDIRGLERIVDGAEPFDGAKRDLGAYEYQHVAPTAVANATPSAAVPGQSINFSGSGSSDIDGDALTYAWSFDDGGSATGAAVSHAFSAAGTHSATLTVTDPTGLANAASASVGVTSPSTGTTGPTGQQAAALKKCKKIKNKAKRRKCKKRAKHLPL
jgi:PKD repeat protein